MDTNKLSVFILPSVYRALITTFSLFAVLPLSGFGYEKGCFVAVSVFLLSKISETVTIQSKYKNLHKHMVPVVFLNIFFAVLSMYFCWGFDTFSDKYITIIMLYVVIAWAIIISGYDYYDLSETLNNYLVLSECQKKTENEE